MADTPRSGAGQSEVSLVPLREIAVATYNIHRCLGTDRRRRPERIAEVIHELDADLIGLQEVDARKLLRKRPDQFKLLSRAFGHHAARGPNIRGPAGDMATTLLSRHPIVAVRTLDLSLPGREPRGAVDADVSIDGVIVRVIVAHLGLRVAERRIQVGRLCEALEERAGEPVIVMGDFNEWHMRRSTLWPLDARLRAASPLPSFPTRLPMLALDRIWAGPQARIDAVRIHRSQLARRASDHLPVRAVICIAAG
jgi:endonuclease/exonuclease/phosphatase family metal-dependent hydrolase